MSREVVMEDDSASVWIDSDGSVCVSGVTAVNASDGYYTLMSKDEATKICHAILAHLNQDADQ